MSTESFWRPFEVEVSSYNDLVEAFDTIFGRWNKKDKVFAWRGQADASWALHSSLYRRLAWSKTVKKLDEEALGRAEHKVLAELHRWGLHVSPSVGRLSVLNQLAALQHYGAPTRLIDVTFNPWIGTWFAVEPKWINGQLVDDVADSRLFAIDITDRLINENDNLRSWEDDVKRPWRSQNFSTDKSNETELDFWCTKVFAWRPAHFDTRIAAQNGGFIFGGVPKSSGPNGPNQWPKGDAIGRWKIAEVRAATSISIRPHKLKATRGAVTQDALYTFRIKAEAKKEIRDRLQKQFGYNHSTIYPDYTGFAEFANPEILKYPPVERCDD